MYMSLISKVKVCVSNKIQRDTEWKILDHNVTTTKIQICDSNIYTLNITDALCLYFSEWSRHSRHSRGQCHKQSSTTMQSLQSSNERAQQVQLSKKNESQRIKIYS